MSLSTFLRFMRKLKRELARDGITPFFILDGGAVRIVFARLHARRNNNDEQRAYFKETAL